MTESKDASSFEGQFSDSSSSSNSTTMTAYSPAHNLKPALKGPEFINSGLCHVPRPPYSVGSTFTATSHEPPAPFGPDYITKMPELPENWKELPQLDTCLSRPSIGGQSVESVTRTLNVTSVIRSGYGIGAQILVMNNNMVAKIYDPLYYEFINEYGYTEPVIRAADGDYLREAAAYTELQSSPAAVKVIPSYYGSFTINIETPTLLQGEEQNRCVPLILIERLCGETMVNIEPTLPDEVRSAITKKVLIADGIIEYAGVHHSDYCPRNIIILNHGQEVTPLTPEYVARYVQIKVIDFNVSTVVRHPSCKFRHLFVGERARRSKSESRMLSPIHKYHGQMMEFYDWVPRRGATAEQWLWQQFHDDDRFLPVTLDSENRPKYLDF